MVHFNLSKAFFSFLFMVLGVFLVLPADAAVAVRRQSKSKPSSAPEVGVPGNTDDRGYVCITLGGIYSARIYADAEGNTHLAYKETSASEEVEFVPELDVIPEAVQAMMDANPSMSFAVALETVTNKAFEDGDYDLYSQLVNAASKAFLLTNEDYWEHAAIYLGDLNDPSEVNTTLTMTGGRVYSIVAAGERYYGDGVGSSEKTEDDTDTGDAVINIQGGTVNFVATSVNGTKYFSGTVKIYLQNCNYNGSYIPNIIDSHCSTTFVATGVTYKTSEARMNTTTTSPNYCQAAYYVLENTSNNVYVKGKDDTVISLPSTTSAINCNNFIVAADTRLSTYVNITASSNFVLFNPSEKPSTYTLAINSTATVQAKRIDVRANAIVRNRGTVNITTCADYGYICTGTWQESYQALEPSKIGLVKRTYNCNTAVTQDHSYTTSYVADADADELLGVTLSEDRTACKWCSKHDASYGQKWYFGTYDITERTLQGTLENDVTFNKIQYSRNFSNTKYQALYLPYAMSYANWSSMVDLYRIKNVHEYDDDNDGTIDRWTLEVVKMKEGSVTKPNTPYVVKPKATGSVTLCSDADAHIYITESAKSIDCSSTDNKFVFTGTPASKTLAANTDFYMTGGALCYGLQDVEIGTYRWFMSIYDRETGDQVLPASFNAAKTIPVFCEEDGEDVTGIVNAEQDAETAPADTAIYDLNGRKVKEMLPGRIYIINGKKVVR